MAASASPEGRRGRAARSRRPAPRPRRAEYSERRRGRRRDRSWLRCGASAREHSQRFRRCKAPAATLPADEEAWSHPRLDRLDRRAGARRGRGAPTSSTVVGLSAAGRAGSGSSSRRAITACRPSPSRTRRRPPRAAAGAGTDRVLAGDEGVRELIAASERGPRAERDRRLGGPRPDDRRAHRGHRRSRSPTRRASSSAASSSPRWPRRRTRASSRSTPSTRRSSSSCDAESPGDGRAPRADRVRRPVPRPHRPRRHHPGGGARAPHLGDGRADHDRLGDADEQGLRGDRGAPPLRRRLRADRRRRPPAVDHPRAGPPERRRLARPPGLPDMRVPISYALHYPERADVDVPGARPRRGRRARPSSSPTRRPSPACAWPARPGRPAAPRRAC